MTYDDACRYVCTDTASGLSQFALLCMEGLTPNSVVLEFGCGALHLARPLLAYLDPGNYLGVDPSEWLRDAARANDPYLDELCTARRARFSSRSDFVHTRALHSFDSVFAHSVMSHLGTSQLDGFLQAVSAALAPTGRALVSLNFGDDTAAEDWTYPEAVTYSRKTIDTAADAAGLNIVERPDYRAFHISIRPAETHDWIVLCPT